MTSKFWSRYWEKQFNESITSKAAFFTKAAAAIYLIREHVAELTVCVGPSMIPTFNPRGDIVLVDHISVATGLINVGDVVIARSVQNPRHVVCKRVLGMEGDYVEVAPPIKAGTSRRVKVPQGHVWLQGDNYYNSTDSRHYGPVPYAVLRGRVVVKVWPPLEIGWIYSKYLTMLVARQVLRPLIRLRSLSECRLHSSSLICRSSAIEGIANARKLAELSPEQRNQVELYLDTLFDWNTRMNLTAVSDREEAYVRHIEDSLSLLPALDACAAAQAPDRHPTISLIDVGSGAGLPGIMLAIARPEWRITLLDSLKKRCTFNETAVEATGLKNVNIKWGRAEDAGQDPRLREQHAIAVARAVAELRQLAELCLPLVSVGGFWIAAKGTNPQPEVRTAENAIKELGGKLMEVQEVDSDGPDGKRCVVIVKKAGFTKKKYPRKAGVPKKQPL